MATADQQHEPEFTVIGGGSPSDALLELLADLLLEVVDAEEVERQDQSIDPTHQLNRSLQKP